MAEVTTIGCCEAALLESCTHMISGRVCASYESEIVSLNFHGLCVAELHLKYPKVFAFF
jgi:hypothetical protein